MATVFERLEEQMKNLLNTIEDLKSLIQDNTTTLNSIKSDFNEAFLNFSDLIGKRLEELEEKIQPTEGMSKKSEPTSINFQNFINEIKDSIKEVKEMMEYIVKSLKDIKITPIKAIPEAVPIISTPKPISKVPKPTPKIPKPFQKIKEVSEDLLPPSKRAPIPFKVGQTVPIEVINLLDSLKTRVEYPAVEFAEAMEQIRDEIVKIYRFHPTLYELGSLHVN